MGIESGGPIVTDVNTEKGREEKEQIDKDGGGSWVNVDTFKESREAEKVREERERKEKRDWQFWHGNEPMPKK